jgi:hypothetical protein
MVADKVVVYDKDLVAPAQLEQGVQFRQQLMRRLRSGLPSVEGDNVAELTLERSAA